MMIFFETTIFWMTVFLTLQGVIFLGLSLYAWNDPQDAESDTKTSLPQTSFTAILPARHEQEVIADTIRAISQIDYPQQLTQTIIVCRNDDPETITAAQKTLDLLQRPDIQLVTFSDFPINKPHGLNIALPHALNDVVVIFDAEDEPHPQIYQKANHIFVSQPTDILQAGVQLVNYQTYWFSPLNVLEYFFWFKSILHVFAKWGVIPLGGNTVFFRREVLEQLGGWDEHCLTEDADIGIRASSLGAITRVYYHEEFATREETPHTIKDFIKQRSRWNQGYIQILLRGRWLQLPGWHRKIIALGLLATPIYLATSVIYLPIAFSAIFFLKLSAGLTLFTLLPAYILIAISLLSIWGLLHFTDSFQLRRHYAVIFTIPLLIVPYQTLLGYCALRGVLRAFLKSTTWEKTTHTNLHRKKFTSDTLASEVI
jgi:cellulose synthase/poly-beta-1,6-N-acetylglucosamine synthase-like glycosyltransferase